jgi:hypothetical protein
MGKYDQLVTMGHLRGGHHAAMNGVQCFQEVVSNMTALKEVIQTAVASRRIRLFCSCCWCQFSGVLAMWGIVRLVCFMLFHLGCTDLKDSHQEGDVMRCLCFSRTLLHLRTGNRFAKYMVNWTTKTDWFVFLGSQLGLSRTCWETRFDALVNYS